MCLDIVDKVTKKANGKGYKIVGEDDEGRFYTGLIQRKEQKLSRSRFTTDNAEGEIHSQKDNTAYPKGYHIFASMQGLNKFREGHGWEEYPVVRVKFRDVVALGEQDGYRVVVARQIKLAT